jgi:hypothetical protein
MADNAPFARPSWSRLAALERIALAAALLTLPLLAAPWLKVTSDPLCIMQDPCPQPQTTMEPGYGALAATVLATAALVAALALLSVRPAALRRCVAASVLVAAGAWALAFPDGPAIRVFAHTSGLAWGGIASLAATGLAALAILASALPRASSENASPGPKA